MGTIAAKTGTSLSSRMGWLVGAMLSSRRPHVSARTTIILPAIKSSGMQSRAESPSCSPRKLQVIRAEASMRRFSTQSGFGVPVEPLVCTSSCPEGLFQSLRNSSSVILSRVHYIY